MRNESRIRYTYLHKKMVVFLANKYVKKDREKILEKVKMHDTDKMFMLLFYDGDVPKEVHRSLSNHHDNSIEKSYDDYVEMVLDWESARYTKEDKPLNAYDTLYKYYPKLENEIMPILKEFGLDKPNLPMDEDVFKYAENIKNTETEVIKKEMKMYLEEALEL